MICCGRILGKFGQRMCVMTSRHSCGEDRKVNEAFRGIAVIKMYDVTPQLRLNPSAKRWMVELT